MLQIKNTLGGGKPEGMYAWSKKEWIPPIIAENPSMSISASNNGTSDYKYIQISSADFDYTQIEGDYKEFFNGFKKSSNSYYFTVSGGYLYLNKDSSISLQIIAFDKSKGIFTMASVYSSISATVSYSGSKTVKDGAVGDTVDYIVSDKETAYPDGGEKDGYWYEKVSGNGLIPLEFNADGYTTKAKYKGDTIPSGLFYVGYKAGTYTIDTQGIGYHISELEIDDGANISQYAFYNSRITSLKILNNTLGSIGTYGFYGVNLLNLQDIGTLTINGDLGSFAIEGIQSKGALPEKIKFKGSSIGQGGIANCYQTPNPSKLWISNNCRTIAGASSSDAGIYNSSSINIYCEPSNKPSGWGSSWYYNCGSVMWGVNESAFDAL